MHDKIEKKTKKNRGFISQALDNATLKLSKLLSSNYNALIFFQMPSLSMYSLNYFPLNVIHAYSFTFEMSFLMFILQSTLDTSNFKGLSKIFRVISSSR